MCSPARGQDRVEDMHVHLLCINDHFTVTGSLAAHQLYWFFICSSSLHFIARRHALSQLALFRVTLVSLTLFPGDYASYSVLNTSPRDSFVSKDTTAQIQQQEVRSSASRYTNQKASPLVLHRGRPFSYGRQPRQPTDELLPYPGHSEVTQNRNGVKVSSWA